MVFLPICSSTDSEHAPVSRTEHLREPDCVFRRLEVLPFSSVVILTQSVISGQFFPLTQHPDEQAQKEKLVTGEDIPKAQLLRDDSGLHGRCSDLLAKLQRQMRSDEVVMAHQQGHIAVEMIPIPGMASAAAQVRTALANRQVVPLNEEGVGVALIDGRYAPSVAAFAEGKRGTQRLRSAREFPAHAATDGGLMGGQRLGMWGSDPG